MTPSKNFNKYFVKLQSFSRYILKFNIQDISSNFSETYDCITHHTGTRYQNDGKLTVICHLVYIGIIHQISPKFIATIKSLRSVQGSTHTWCSLTWSLVFDGEEGATPILNSRYSTETARVPNK